MKEIKNRLDKIEEEQKELKKTQYSIIIYLAGLINAFKKK